MTRTFVGIGFGPIQSGLFLLEAQASGNFERLVVGEINPDVVAAVRSAGGTVRINVAHHDRVQVHELTELEIYNPLVAGDMPRLIDALAEADEIATALPSVEFFDRGRPSPVKLLALAIERKLADHRLPRAIIYTAENDNHAAEKLCHAVKSQLSEVNQPRLDERVAFLNTVIGKMSGIVTDAAQIDRSRLAPMVDDNNSAILVEEFNHILISQIPLADFRRGIARFQEKPDLLPFERAKLFGHNAAHALLGFLANQAELTFIHQTNAELREFVRQAFLEESGIPLCRAHADVDPLFTSQGWSDYVNDLLQRMVNPYLEDRVDRIVRDPCRKLGWNDRLIGTMRLALEHGIEPRRYATGAAAASNLWFRERPATEVSFLLGNLWREDDSPPQQTARLIELIESAKYNLQFPPTIGVRR